MILTITILALFLVPISSCLPIKGTCVWFPQLLCLQLIGAFAFGYQFWKLNKFLGIFLFYLAFSYILVTEASPRTMICLMTGYMAASILLIVTRLKNTKPVYFCLAIMSILTTIFALLQSWGIDPIFIPNDSSRYSGIVSFMGSHNQLGIYSAATAFCYPWLMAFSIIPMYLAKCNSTLLGLICGAFIYIYFRYGNKSLAWMILIIVCLGMPWFEHCGKSRQELMERINLWKLTATQAITGITKQEKAEDETHSKFQFKIIKANPLTGFGLGKFFEYSPMSQFPGDVFDKIYNQKLIPEYGNIHGGAPHYYEHAHNDFLEAWYELGYIGVALIICIVVSTIMAFIYSKKTLGVIITFSSLVAQSVSSCSVYVFHAPVSLFMFCLMFGLFYAEIANAKTQGTICKNPT